MRESPNTGTTYPTKDFSTVILFTDEASFPKKQIYFDGNKIQKVSLYNEK
jgi:hypothetical protein